MSSHGILSSFPCFRTEGASPTVRDRFAACVNPEAMSRKKAISKTTIIFIHGINPRIQFFSYLPYNSGLLIGCEEKILDVMLHFQVLCGKKGDN